MSKTIIIGVSASAEIVDLTPEKLAEFFWDMDSNEQARFFNHLADISGASIVFQLQYISDSEELSGAGRDLMQRIGEYSKQTP